MFGKHTSVCSNVYQCLHEQMHAVIGDHITLIRDCGCNKCCRPENNSSPAVLPLKPVPVKPVAVDTSRAFPVCMFYFDVLGTNYGPTDQVLFMQVHLVRILLLLVLTQYIKWLHTPHSYSLLPPMLAALLFDPGYLPTYKTFE